MARAPEALAPVVSFAGTGGNAAITEEGDAFC